LGAFAIVAGGLGLGFGPFVRAKIARVAAQRHLDVDVGGVRPGFFSIGLRDVRIKPQGVDGVVANIQEVDVSLSAAFAPKEVYARGGEIIVHGEPTELKEKLRALRGESAYDDAAAEPKSPGSGIRVRADDFRFSFSVPDGATIDADGVHVEKDGVGTKVHVQNARISDPKIAVTLTSGDVEIDAANNLRRVSAETMNVAAARVQHEVAHDPAASSTEPAPPPLPAQAPAVAKGGRGKAGKTMQTASTSVALPADAPLFPLPDPRNLRAKLALATTELVPRIPRDSTFAVSNLTFSLKTDEGDLTLGPGPLTLKHEGDDVRITFSAEAKDAGKNKAPPLALEAEIPLSGGPVSLARLGLKEKAGGLEHVDDATLEGKGRVVLSDDGSALTFDIDVRAKKIALNQPRLAPESIENLNVAVAARGVLTSEGQLRLDDARASLGETKLELRGTLEQKADHASMAMTFTVPIASCQAMVDSAPAALLPTVRNARFAGTFSATGRISFDTRKLDDLSLDYQIADECRITEVPRELARDRFTKEFAHTVVLPDGKPKEEKTGPGTDAWTDLDHISPFMMVAVLTTEDGGFFRHHGFNHPAFRNSLVANLKARKFVRGASTISMQLTKNLFLSRTKSMSRKLEELILTDYLEQVFSKDELMELYLNVIEFGPDVYGITKAAEVFFGRKPEELTIAECLYLSSLLPSPIRYFHIKEKGEVPEYWMKHIYSLMEIAEKNGRLSKKELTEGQTEKIVFWKEGDPRPAARPPVLAPRVESSPEDQSSDWKPVD
jgi:hypothetical protein